MRSFSGLREKCPRHQGPMSPKVRPMGLVGLLRHRATVSIRRRCRNGRRPTVCGAPFAPSRAFQIPQPARGCERQSAACRPDGSRHQGPFWPRPPLAINSHNLPRGARPALPARGRPPSCFSSCSRRTGFSSIKNAMTPSCRWFTHPAKVRKRNCNAGAVGIGEGLLGATCPRNVDAPSPRLYARRGRSSPGKAARAEFPDRTGAARCFDGCSVWMR